MSDPYQTVFWIYLALALLTLYPTCRKFLGKVKLNPGGSSFNESSYFSEDGRKRLDQHYSRLQGTLGFWKKQAGVFTSFHYYCVSWTILSAWAVPLLSVTQPSGASDAGFAKWLIVLVSSHVALSLSFHKGMKVAEGMKAF